MRLVARLRRSCFAPSPAHVNAADRVDIAVAWLGPSRALDELLRRVAQGHGLFPSELDHVLRSLPDWFAHSRRDDAPDLLSTAANGIIVQMGAAVRGA